MRSGISFTYDLLNDFGVQRLPLLLGSSERYFKLIVTDRLSDRGRVYRDVTACAVFEKGLHGSNTVWILVHVREEDVRVPVAKRCGARSPRCVSIRPSARRTRTDSGSRFACTRCHSVLPDPVRPLWVASRPRSTAWKSKQYRPPHGTGQERPPSEPRTPRSLCAPLFVLPWFEFVFFRADGLKEMLSANSSPPPCRQAAAASVGVSFGSVALMATRWLVSSSRSTFRMSRMEIGAEYPSRTLSSTAIPCRSDRGPATPYLSHHLFLS